ncbi:MAG: hypothetical protein RR234_08685, partial [Christensenella sp.]
MIAFTACSNMNYVYKKSAVPLYISGFCCNNSNMRAYRFAHLVHKQQDAHNNMSKFSHYHYNTLFVPLEAICTL